MAVPIVMPRLGDFMTEGVVVRWGKARGDWVEQGEVVAEIESEKTNYDLEATDSGLFHPLVPEGATAPVDGVLGYLLAEGESPPTPPSTPESAPAPAQSIAAPSVAPTQRPTGEVVPSTPGARRLAAKLGIDISAVKPSGPRGRVTEADVRSHAEGPAAAPLGPPTLPPGLPVPSKAVPLEGLRKTIAVNMRESVSTTAQVSFMLEVDVTEATRLRREASRKADDTLTTADVLIAACARSLKRHPQLNTVLKDGTVFYFDDVNAGLAVAVPDGIVVPVVRRADQKDVYQISRETRELTARAREGKLLPDDMVGGTFTISVLGTVDGFTPILNPGQSAVLGAGRAVEKPVVSSGEVVIREMMTLSLTVDHQVVDGAVAAGFLRRLQQTIERPAQLFKAG